MKCSHFVSKSGQKVAKTRFYIIRNLFENFMNVWATFVRLFMAKIFYKSPDLVTLAPHTLHWQTQSSLTHADLGLCVYSNEKLFIRKWVKAIFVWPTGSSSFIRLPSQTFAFVRRAKQQQQQHQLLLF